MIHGRCTDAATASGLAASAATNRALWPELLPGPVAQGTVPAGDHDLSALAPEPSSDGQPDPIAPRSGTGTGQLPADRGLAGGPGTFNSAARLFPPTADSSALSRTSRIWLPAASHAHLAPDGGSATRPHSLGMEL
jgi:hypothetical protein